MIFKLVVQGLMKGRARFACAVSGIALATGALVFMTSLVSTNAAQASLLARAACRPWAAWQVDGFSFGRRGMIERGDPSRGRKADAAEDRPRKTPEKRALGADLVLKALPLSIDYRPGGHVLQGPPMMAILAAAPAENPYASVSLTEGRWLNPSSEEPEIVCVKAAMKRFGRMPAPMLGETLKFVGKNVTMSAKIVGYLDGGRLPMQFPGVLANAAAVKALAGEEWGAISFFKEGADPAKGLKNGEKLLTPDSEEVIRGFRGDENMRMDYARPLLLLAALLTALSLLVNSLLLSVEANRKTLSTLRLVGLTRGGIVRFVAVESFLAGVFGWLIGVAGAAGALALYVAADRAAFPMGAVLDVSRIKLTAVLLPVVALLALLFALAPALRVRAMEASGRQPRSRRRGMAITFALGFAAFVAVEVWGASLMRAFVPSPEWPDAIVSLLPGGVSSFEVEKLRDIEGVRRITELLPLQLFFCEDPDVPKPATTKAGPKAGPREKPNILFLAGEWLPDFIFTEGDWASANEAVMKDEGVVIADMVARARNLHKGDKLSVLSGRPPRAQRIDLPIVGVVDLNWHMVTSRGLVRGLNGGPRMPVGPAFCSLDTLESIDPRPAFMVKMTHLWVEYEKEYLARNGVFGAGRKIEAEIARRLGNPAQATVRLHARDEIADGTLAHGNDIIGAAARVPFVFLAILAIGFVAMLVAEADARRRTFVVLRTVGATRAQLAARLALSAAKTALFGLLIGLPLGVAAGFAATFPTAAIWPGLPHYLVVPWSLALMGGLGAFIFALLFAIPTALVLVSRATKRHRV